MKSTRRDFLGYSLATGAFLAASGCQSSSSEKRAAQKSEEPPKKKLTILILGGTGFLGPAIVTAARERGHTLTLFNRGKTNPGLFTDIEQLHGDRDPKKGEGITALANRKWDVVFDDCGYYPRMVAASAEMLAPNVKHYVYISSISAYKHNDIENMDESGEVATMPDPTLESMGKEYEFYGSLKALCEAAAEKAMPGRVANVRPGYIVGPGDPTDRFTYWPARFDKGGDVLVPGNRTDPVQVIDVRDLAEWLVHVAETDTTGVFNACGPEKKLEWGRTIDACVASSSKPAKPRWASTEVLRKFEVGEMPIWAPYEGESKGSHMVGNAKAVQNGMRFRSIDTTVKDTLAWFKGLPAERQAKLFERNLSAEKEAEVIKSLA
jgi:2'-hydroxyisoflavone reductase